jgi:hypothetical protein
MSASIEPPADADGSTEPPVDGAADEAAADGAVEVPGVVLQAAKTIADAARRPATRVRVRLVVNVVPPDRCNA